MAKLTKRARLIKEKVDSTKVYAIDEAIDLLKDVSSVKFAESVARYYPHYLLTTFFYVALWHIANRFISLESDVADAELQSITQESNND